MRWTYQVHYVLIICQNLNAHEINELESIHPHTPMGHMHVFMMESHDFNFLRMMNSDSVSITGIITILNVEIHILIFLNPYMQTHPLNVCMIGFRV
jgi:hypothetical protein